MTHFATVDVFAPLQNRTCFRTEQRTGSRSLPRPNPPTGGNREQSDASDAFRAPREVRVFPRLFLPARPSQTAPTLVKKKICMLGAPAVGKTSLVRRFVKGIFRDEYVTTIGVQIEKKTVAVEGEAVNLILWDVNGEDRFQSVSSSYIRGAAGYLLVVDGTRPQTLDTAQSLHERAQDEVGRVPFYLLVNKADLRDGGNAAERDWSVTPETLEQYSLSDWPVLYTSAKDGTHVEQAFTGLAEAFVGA